MQIVYYSKENLIGFSKTTSLFCTTAECVTALNIQNPNWERISQDTPLKWPCSPEHAQIKCIKSIDILHATWVAPSAVFLCDT